MVDNQVVSISEEGVLIGSGQGVKTIRFAELNAGHALVKDSQSYQLGVWAGIHIANITMANK